MLLTISQKWISMKSWEQVTQIKFSGIFTNNEEYSMNEIIMD